MTGAMPREIADLLREAAVWRTAGLLLERPRDRLVDDVAALGRESSEPLLADAASLARELDEGAYLSTLGPGGPVSPREAAYLGFGDPGHALSEVRTYYEAFAYRPRAEDPPDHIAVEAGFVGYLFLKEAFLRDAGRTEAADTVARARERFVDGHVRRVAAPLARRLDSLGAATALCRAARVLAARAGEADEPLPVVVEDEERSLPICPNGSLD